MIYVTVILQNGYVRWITR